MTLGVNSAAFAGTDTFVDTPSKQVPIEQLLRSMAWVLQQIFSLEITSTTVSFTANATNKHSGIVVGPNSHIIVYASTADLIPSKWI